MKTVEHKNPLKNKTPYILQKIIANVENPEKERSDALFALGKIKSQQSIEFLINQVTIREETLKEQIIWTIGEIGGRIAYDFLKRLLFEPQQLMELRLAAAMSLYSMGHKIEVAPILMKIQDKLHSSRKARKEREKKELKDEDIIPFIEREEKIILYLIGSVSDDILDRLINTIDFLKKKICNKILVMDFSEVSEFRLQQMKKFHIFLMNNTELISKIHFTIKDKKIIESIAKSGFFHGVEIIDKI